MPQRGGHFYALYAYRSANLDQQGRFRWKIWFQIVTADGLPILQQLVYDDGDREDAEVMFESWRRFCRRANGLQGHRRRALQMFPVV